MESLKIFAEILKGNAMMNTRRFIFGNIFTIMTTWIISIVSYLIYVALRIKFNSQNHSVDGELALAAVIFLIVISFITVLIIIRNSWESQLANSSRIFFSPLYSFVLIVGAAASLACPLVLWKVAAIFPQHLIGTLHLYNLTSFGAITVSIYIASMVIYYPFYLRRICGDSIPIKSLLTREK